MTTASPLGDSRAAWLLAGVEFFFALSWVVYVIFLPELLARGGIDRRYLPWIIAADQLIFALADWWMGVAVDRARAALRRIGSMLVLLSAVSALAMLLMPWLAATPVLFLLAISVWVATSSALRAPPYVLLSRYAGRATLPRLAGIQLLGLAVASALAPYLAIILKGVDPALPFLLSALAVAVSALALVYEERRLPAAAPMSSAAADSPAAAASGSKPTWTLLLLLALLLAFGQQVHSLINSAAHFKRLADPALLPWLMPVFWVGFSFGLLGVGRLVRARGPLQVLQVACPLGALALAGAALSVSLAALLLSQFIAGIFWASILCASIGLAADSGNPLHTGRHTGALMATLAVAAFSRVGLAASGGAAVLGAQVLDWLPVALWCVVAVIVRRMR
jgi:MFS family permease